jgi:uncharacterized Zn finger protein
LNRDRLIERSVETIFRLSYLVAAVGQEVCARGAAHQHAGHVSDVKLSNRGHMITAYVRETAPSPHRVTASVSRARDSRTLIVGYCDCPAGLDCEHVAATHLAVLEVTESLTRWPTAIASAMSWRRIGQTRHVFVYELQDRKSRLAAAIFSESAATSARFAAADVERLFAPLGP